MKFLFHSPLEMDLTHAIMFTKKIQELFHAAAAILRPP